MRFGSYSGPLTDHYDGSHFYNLDKVEQKGLWEVLKWRMARTEPTWPEELENSPFIRPKAWQDKNSSGFFVIGHASVLIKLGPHFILVDPQYSKRASPFSFVGPRRVRPPAIPFDQLPHIDFVLISHNHYDHLDISTLQRLKEKSDPLILIGLGHKNLLKKNGFSKFRELDWWQSHKKRDLEISFVPARHFSSRGLFDQNKALWGGFYLNYKLKEKVFFAGDTGYGRHFRLIRERLGAPHLSFLPIGAYKPRWFMQEVHINPEEAVKAHRELRSKQSVGIHFATFSGMSDEDFADPEKDLIKAREKLKIRDNAIKVANFTAWQAFLPRR